jgi:hypothetical protein
MSSLWPEVFVVIVATLVVVSAAVTIHYRGLNFLAEHGAQWTHRFGRRTVLIGIVVVLLLHTIEIGVFGLAWWTLLQWPGLGSIPGMTGVDLPDALFLSSLAFTSLGFDNLTPGGPVRILAAIEALSGFVLITWSASFTYLDMSRHWRDRHH